LVGIVGFNLDALTTFFKHLVPYFIILTAVVVFSFHRKFDSNFIIYTLVVVSSSVLIEMLGVSTKLIFGDYTYGHTLGYKIFDVPFIIGVNWLTLSYTSCCIAWRTSKSFTARTLTSGLLMVFMDIIMEPVAIRFDYWSWLENNIPFQNYAVWFVLSLIYAMLFFSLEIDARNRIARNIYLILLFFFIALNIS
jgi:putative membrane protein